jgi:hypothetical protein
LLVGALVSAASLLLFQDPAFAEPPDLPAVFLANSLPGFSAEPPGPTNGPIDGSNLKYLGMSSSAASSMGQQIAAGRVSGFIRTWAHDPVDGDGVIISAFWFQKSHDLVEFTAGEGNGAQGASGIPFLLPGLPGASGYSIEESNISVFVVLFTKADTAFQVDVVNGSHDLTRSDAVSLAQRQVADIPGDIQPPGVTQTSGGVQSPSAGQSPGGVQSRGAVQTSGGTKTPGEVETPGAIKTPGAVQTFGAVPVAAQARASRPGGSAAHDAGRTIGGLLLTALVAVGVVIGFRRLCRRRRIPPGVPAEAAATAASEVGASTASSSGPLFQAALAPGWYPIGTGSDDQRYWDGQAWVARLRWTGETWVDVPGGSQGYETRDTSPQPAHESAKPSPGVVSCPGLVAPNRQKDVSRSEQAGSGSTELEVCVWQQVGCRTDRVVQPSDSAISEAIRRLDGASRNDLYIRAAGGPWMGVAGGPDRVIVTFADGDEGPFFQAVTSPSPDGEDVRVCVAGQPVWMPARTLVSEEDAIAAAIEFVRSAERPLSLAWSS